MVASPRSLRHLFSVVPLAAGIFSSEATWGVSQVWRNEVEVEKSSWKMLADSVDDFVAVLEAFSVHLEITALILETAEGGTFESCHNHLGAGHILATVAHNLDIVGLRC